MFYIVCLNDKSYEDTQRYSVGKHVVNVRRFGAWNEFGAILHVLVTNFKWVGSNDCTTRKKEYVDSE